MHVLAILFLLTSCAVNMKTPSSRSLSPEIQGHLNGSWNASGSGSSNVSLNTLNNDMTNPLDIDNNLNISWANIEFAFFNFIDLVFLSGGDSTQQVGAKIKLFGPSRVEAKEGDSSLSLYVGGGSESDDDFDGGLIFFPGTRADAKVDMKVATVGLLYGYRVRSHTLIGASFFYDRYDFKGEFTGGPNTSLVGSSFDYEGKIMNLGLYAIFYTHSGIYTRFEIAAQNSKWTYTDEVTMGLGSFAFGASF